MYHLLAQAGEINLIPPAGSLGAAIAGITIGRLLGGLANLVIIVAAVAFFFMLILGGVQWITSGGDKAKTESARSQITAAVVGLIIVFSTWAIITFIEAFFNVNIRYFTIPSI